MEISSNFSVEMLIFFPTRAVRCFKEMVSHCRIVFWFLVGTGQHLKRESSLVWPAVAASLGLQCSSTIYDNLRLCLSLQQFLSSGPGLFQNVLLKPDNRRYENESYLSQNYIFISEQVSRWQKQTRLQGYGYTENTDNYYDHFRHTTPITNTKK